VKGTLVELGLKTVEPCTIGVVEDRKNYGLKFVRTWDGKEFEFIGFYRVTTIDGKDHYCIAEDEAGAVSQVSCLNKDLYESGSIAIRLPFLIRGWGGTIFEGYKQEKTQDDKAEVLS